MPRTDLKTLNRNEMGGFVETLGWPRFRAGQLLGWIYRKGATEFGQMSNLSKEDRSLLMERAEISRLDCVRQDRSFDGTEKILFRLQDGQEVESVLIPDDGGGKLRPRERLTLCISTQVGCTLDCHFCLTGTMGLARNLAAHEIVDQVLEARRMGRPVTNIVMMGMGEPLANYNEVIESLNRLTHPAMSGIPPRKITVSTAGLVPQILKLGRSGLPVNLAVSLNATTDETRERIMPAVHRLYPLADLMAALRSYPLPPRRHLFFEYVLLAGENDTVADARRLVGMIAPIRCKVNLIPFNEYPGAAYRRPSGETVLRFQEVLMASRIPAFIRKSRGRDILAACGQLRTTISHPQTITLTT